MIWSREMKQKKVIIAIVAVIVIICLISIYLLLQQDSRKEEICFMSFNELDEEPSEFINITDSEIQKYPFITDGITSQEISKKCEDFEEFLNFIDQYNTRNIYYNNSYYHIAYVTP
jgi:hypothetical protein